LAWGLLISVLMLVGDPPQLVLDSAGFRFSTLRRGASIRWSDVRNIRVVRIGIWPMTGRRVGWDLLAPSMPERVVKDITTPLALEETAHGSLAFNYGRRAEELARLMGEWHDRHKVGAGDPSRPPAQLG
jgi:hypothetical protein